MTATLAAWLEQQVAADEALATAATAGPWTRDSGWSLTAPAPEEWSGPYVVVETNQRNDAEFVAANDPAQTLRRVAAIRQVLALHHSEIEDDPDPFCAECADEDWPCPTLRALASMFADRGGYRAEEWA